MEEEGKKKASRWAESLADAGLIDEINDSWVLPEDQPVEGSTITVEGLTGDQGSDDRDVSPGIPGETEDEAEPNGSSEPTARTTRKRNGDFIRSI